MRLASVLLAMTLIAAPLLINTTPAMALDVNDSTPTFGTFACKPSFSCPSLSNSEAVKTLTGTVLSLASSCVANRLGLSSPKGFFETGLGLDGSLCLTTKKLTKNESGLTMVPKCCVKPISTAAGTCQVVCTRYGVK